MWSNNGNDIQMAEGDFGVVLPVTVSGVTLSAQDALRFVFKRMRNGETILTKEYTPVNGTAPLEFTEEESALFPVGEYVYSLDWYQGDLFLCNVIPWAKFKVVDKA